MSINIDRWHYPRPELAGQYLDFFDTGLSNSLVLFAPRRFGKTEFLLQDLAPKAEQAGYSLAYIDFWQSQQAPLAVLLSSLEGLFSKKPFSERFHQLLTTPITKIKLSGSLAGSQGAAEIDLGQFDNKMSDDLLVYLGDLLNRLARRKKPLLILMDEVQQLAVDARNEALVAALRSGMDRNKQKIKTISTGSSRDKLILMFSEKTAPFFHFSTQLDFPQLDKQFVQHILKIFRQVNRRRLDLDEACRVFDDIGNVPFYFRKVIEQMLADPDKNFSTALEFVRRQLPAEMGYPALWQRLKITDKMVLEVLASGSGSGEIYTKNARSDIGKKLQTDLLSVQEVQGSIRRLTSKGIIFKSPQRGRYSFDDPELQQWVNKLLAD